MGVTPPELILASGSPRRRELLAGAGFTFRVILSPGDEIHDPLMDPDDLCRTNARAKCAAVAGDHPEAVVIGADTLVFLEGKPLGKPKSLDEARDMLRQLSGKIHHVRTGVAMMGGGRIETFAVTTEVVFRPLDDAAIHAYFESVDPLDKAGGYAVQESGDRIIAEVRGSFTNVIGLPVEETVEALQRLGVRPTDCP